MSNLMRTPRIPLFGSMMEDFWNNLGLLGRQSNADSIPAVNIKDLENAYDIELAAPGFQKEDFKINLEHGTLSISAERKTEKNEQEDNYTRKEFSYSSFSRSFSLPEDVKEEKVKAKYENGLLHLTLEKTTPSLAHKTNIPIE